MSKAADDIEVFRCPVCHAPRRFAYKIHRDDFAGECGHRLTTAEALAQIVAK